MEERYNHAIKAGVIGGVVLLVLSILNLITDLVQVRVLQLALGCFIFLLVIVAAAGIGAFAVRSARPVLHTLTDALVVSGVAGLIAGVVYAVMNVVVTFVRSILEPREISDILASYGLPTSSYSFAQGLGGSCCCAPVLVIIIIVVAMIGGALYAVLIAKIP